MNTSIRLLSLTIATLLGGGLSLPVAGAEPAPTALSDARAEARIETTYRLSPYLRADRLDVEVSNGIATLKGSVPEEVSKELATAIASGIEGVSEVRNELTIGSGTATAKPRRFGEVLDDGTINEAIESKLAWSRFADDLQVVVATRDGGVTLTGHARSADARAAANRLAATTRGVGAVDDRIVVGEGIGMVKPASAAPAGTAISDTWITTKVKYTLLYSSNVAGSDIDVSTEAGVVSLRGTLHSGIERALAIELAQNIGGVKKVDAEGLTSDPVVSTAAVLD
ncbi:MAG: BON domain-containing protein [Aquimonas sp.]|jgi:hyperosmotically inducible protein